MCNDTGNPPYEVVPVYNVLWYILNSILEEKKITMPEQWA